ncbi:hypothetical protein [Sphingobium sp. WCS2017Hpa-17]|nr:hypothetical protein [Sphingobium sp. WCS2017Hpa-17]
MAKSVIRADGFFARPFSKSNGKKPKILDNREIIRVKAYVISCL